MLPVAHRYLRSKRKHKQLATSPVSKSPPLAMAGSSRRRERVGVSLSLAHVVGALVLSLSFVEAATVVRVLRVLLFGYFLLLSADLVLTRYHLWRFEPTAPELKRYALVTGASAGMGRDMAYMLAEQRYSLVLAARSEQVLERMKREIELVHKPVEVLVCACDLSTREGIAKLIKFVEQQELVIDILINNAGISITKDFVDMTTAEIDGLMTLDMMALVQLTHAIVPKMIKRGVGRVLNVSSIAASFVTPTAAVYSSSKAFVSSFTQALSYELRSTGVTATCFVPGPVETNFAETANIKRSISMILPGIQNHPKDAAKVALDAMFNADIIRHDSWFSFMSAAAARVVLPPRISGAVGASGMQEPSRLWWILKR